MFNLLQSNKDNILNHSDALQYSNNIYGILLKTGKYVNIYDINHQSVKKFY